MKLRGIPSTNVGRPPPVARVWLVPSDQMETLRSLSSSPRPPHLTQRMPGVETTLQECRRTGAFSAESEAERHSVAVRLAVRIGEIHCGAIGKPSGINTFKSEDPWLSQARNKPSEGEKPEFVKIEKVQTRH